VDESGNADVRKERHAVRDLGIVVELDEEVPGDAEGEKVDGRSADDLVGPQVDREEGVDERQQAAGGCCDEDADHPRSPFVGAVDSPKGAHQQHSFEPDVHHAAALREDAGDCAEDERRREAEGLRDQRRVEDGLEVSGSRAGGEDAEADAEHAGRHGSPTEPTAATRRRPDSKHGRDDPDEDRPCSRPRLDRRNREEGGEGRQGRSRRSRPSPDRAAAR